MFFINNNQKPPLVGVWGQKSPSSSPHIFHQHKLTHNVNYPLMIFLCNDQKPPLVGVWGQKAPSFSPHIIHQHKLTHNVNYPLMIFFNQQPKAPACGGLGAKESLHQYKSSNFIKSEHTVLGIINQ
jgi:hypothetical protein